MNLKQLRAFRQVMLTGSVSEAARNLHRSQPAITSLIAGLEENIGLKLFVRRGGRLHPVPEAHYLLEEASEIISRLNAVERTMRNVRELDHGVLKVVSMAGPSAFMLPRLIADFAENRQQVQISLVTRTSIQVEQLIAVQQFDIGLADLNFADIARSPLVNYEAVIFDCLCAMPAKDPLADKEFITAADLHDKPMATLYAEHPTSTHTKTAFAQMGARLNVRFETVYFVPMFTYIESGLAYAVVDPLSAESYRQTSGAEPQIVFRPFRPKVLLHAAVMTPAHRPLSILAKTFHTILCSEISRVEKKYSIAHGKYSI